MNKKISLHLSILFLAALLNGCAGHEAPPLAINNPANPEARESAASTPDNLLGADATTQETRRQFNKASHEND